MEFGADNLVRMEIPYEGGVIAGWFCRAEWGDGPRPTIIFVNGLDSSKEMLVWTRLGRELARRGVSTLHIDQPGSGEALRVHGLAAVYDTERLGCPGRRSPRDDRRRRPGRIGLAGWSLGGYYPPRAAAFKKRLKLGRRLGRQPQLGRGPDAAVSSARGKSRAALLGARPMGVGHRGRRRSSSSTPSGST